MRGDQGGRQGDVVGRGGRALFPGLVPKKLEKLEVFDREPGVTGERVGRGPRMGSGT